MSLSHVASDASPQSLMTVADLEFEKEGFQAGKIFALATPTFINHAHFRLTTPLIKRFRVQKLLDSKKVQSSKTKKVQSSKTSLLTKMGASSS